MAPKQPRGIRNNNPGNLIKNHIEWNGMNEIQDDPNFIIFSNPVFGLRALIKLLINYNKIHGLNTVSTIINRWAPPHENATNSYAQNVANYLSVNKDQHLNLRDDKTLIKLAKVITIQENGHPPKDKPQYWYSDKTYQQAANLALNNKQNYT